MPLTEKVHRLTKVSIAPRMVTTTAKATATKATTLKATTTKATTTAIEIERLVRAKFYS